MFGWKVPLTEYEPGAHSYQRSCCLRPETKFQTCHLDGTVLAHRIPSERYAWRHHLERCCQPASMRIFVHELHLLDSSIQFRPNSLLDLLNSIGRRRAGGIGGRSTRLPSRPWVTCMEPRITTIIACRRTLAKLPTDLGRSMNVRSCLTGGLDNLVIKTSPSGC